MGDEQNKQPVEKVFEFGLENEFSSGEGLGGIETADVAGLPAEPVKTQKFKKTVDFGDGPLDLEADTPEDLIDMVLAAKEDYIEQHLYDNADQQIGELPPPRQYNPVNPPTNDELAAAIRGFATNPLETHRKLTEWSTGMAYEEFMDSVQAAREVKTRIYGDMVGRDFVIRHQNDYFPCPENATKIMRHLQAKGMPPTPQNYDHAFAQLNAIHALKPFPEDEEVQGRASVSGQASTALSGDNSSYPSKEGKPDLEEYERKLWQMPYDQLRKVVQSR